MRHRQAPEQLSPVGRRLDGPIEGGRDGPTGEGATSVCTLPRALAPIDLDMFAQVVPCNRKRRLNRKVRLPTSRAVADSSIVTPARRVMASPYQSHMKICIRIQPLGYRYKCHLGWIYTENLPLIPRFRYRVLRTPFLHVRLPQAPQLLHLSPLQPNQ